MMITISASNTNKYILTYLVILKNNNNYRYYFYCCSFIFEYQHGRHITVEYDVNRLVV